MHTSNAQSVLKSQEQTALGIMYNNVANRIYKSIKNVISYSIAKNNYDQLIYTDNHIIKMFASL